MGCTSSKLDHEDNVERCKNRRRFMKQAVASRHALAAAHVAYIYALKNVGAAFRQFGESDLQGGRSRLLDPPSPPPPSYYLHSSNSAPFHRSRSLPALALQNGGPPPDKSKLLSPPASPPEEEDYREQKDYLYGDAQPLPPPPIYTDAAPRPTGSRSSSWDFTDVFIPSSHLNGKQSHESREEQNGSTNYSSATYARKGYQSERYGYEQRENERYDSWGVSSPDNSIVKSEVVNELACMDRTDMALVPSLATRSELGDVLKVVDEWFMRAFECGKDVGRMLEALRIQYHSSFLKPKGFSDRPGSTIGRSMSLGRWTSPSQRMTLSLKGLIDDIDGCGMAGSHASTLDRLFAWEKRLYEEVKGAEMIRTEYDKQCVLLRRKNTKGAGNESIDKTRATIKSLQTRIVIALQAVDTDTKALRALRDEQLYPQLLEILKGMTSMWNEMYDCHQRQVDILLKMKALEELESADATSNMHRQATSQLELSLTNWYNALSKVINTQREYLHNVNSWLRLTLLPIETEPQDRLSSLRNDPPLIYHLCVEWQQVLDRLPEKVALEAIKSFSAVVRHLVDLQSDEVRHKKKVEALFKELQRREAALENYERKHSGDVTYESERNEAVIAVVPHRTSHSTRKAAVDVLKRKLNEENEKMRKAIQETRAITINNFQTGLPSIFQAVTGFAQVCSHAYQGVYTRIDATNYSRNHR